MLRIELAALSAQELKRLLDMARARNQGALAAQLLAELEARPMRAEDWSPRPMGYAPPTALDPGAPAPPRRGGMAATAVIAAFVSAAVTWGISVPPFPREAPPAPPAPAPPRAAVVLASLAPVTQAGDLAERAATPEGQLARAAPQPRSRGNPCYDLPTAAERLLCGFPALAAQDRQLRAAYDRALAAGADRRDLDRAQALWRETTQDVSDRQLLAERYSRRIRELEAAATPPPPEDPPF